MGGTLLQHDQTKMCVGDEGSTGLGTFESSIGNRLDITFSLDPHISGLLCNYLQND